MATNIPLVSDNDLIRTTWGNTVRTEVSNLDANTVKKAGSTMTGALLLPSPQSTNAASAIRKDYVDGRFVTVTGDIMTGRLTLNPGDDICARLQGTAPYIDFWNEAGSARYGYIRGGAGSNTLFADSAYWVIYANGVDALVLRENVALFGKSASDNNADGVEIYTGNTAVKGRMTSTVSDTNAYMNFYARHMGAMDGNAKFFEQFARSSAGTVIGSISQVNLTGVAFNETSDYRLKDDLGDVASPLERVAQLRPRHLRWKEDQTEFDGFLAHEVQTVVPNAVAGEKDAVLPDDHDTDPGGIDPQQLDTGKLIPLLTAAVQELTAKVAELEARLAA